METGIVKVMKARSPWRALGAFVLGAAMLVPASAAAQDKPLFEYHGYLRSGFAVSSGDGGDQTAFSAPGAFAKWRLGNEAETYGELGFTANWLGGQDDGVWFKTEIKLAVITGNIQAFESLTPDGTPNQIALQESYAQAGNIFESQPGMSFWAGQRFYDRHDIYINDFFYWDMSGYGGGFEGMDLEFGKLAVAYLGATNEPGGRDVKNHIDIRLSDIEVPAGKLTVGAAPVLQSVIGGDDVFGVAGTVMHTMGGFMGGFNKLSVQFGYGAQAGLQTYFSSGQDDAWMLRVVEQAQIQPSESFSMMWAGIFQLDNTDAVDGANMWIGLGARPNFHFGKYTSLAVEAGIDLVQPDGGDLNYVGKLTVAPTIRAGSSFWGRPEIRAFFTGAFWSSDLEGVVGGPAFADDTFGTTFGVQAESWW